MVLRLLKRSAGRAIAVNEASSVALLRHHDEFHDSYTVIYRLSSFESDEDANHIKGFSVDYANFSQCVAVTETCVIIFARCGY